MGKVYAAQTMSLKIQSSSVVERSAVNRLVVGSNPTSGAVIHKQLLVSPTDMRVKLTAIRLTSPHLFS